jgi:serine/threonine protein kinase
LAPARVVGGRYQLDAALDESGGVRRAVDRATGGVVAVKCFEPPLSALAFRREVAIAARARHPNLVSLLDAGRTEDRGWLVTEYVPGMEMRDRLRSYGPMGARRALDVATQLFSALDALHRRGVAHGDIKPDNVLFEVGRVRVFDYGLGRMLDDGARGAGVFPGTLPYMHPALFQGAVPDRRTDCFAGWVTCYELLAGRLPFTVRELRSGDPLPTPKSVGDTALDALLAAGLGGHLADARSAWVALLRFLTGRHDLPPPATPALPIGTVEEIQALIGARERAALVGSPERCAAVLGEVRDRWERAGGTALRAAAAWGSPGEALSGALSLTLDALHGFDAATLATVGTRLGEHGHVLASAAPALRAWLGTSSAPASTEHLLAHAIRAFLDVCPGRLLLLVDELDRMDSASRALLITSSLPMVASVRRAPPAPLAAVHLPWDAPADESRVGRLVRAALDAARSADIPFGPALAHHLGIDLDELDALALDAEEAGVAAWDGEAIRPIPRGYAG